MTSSTKGQPYLVSGERRDKQRTEEQARADREARMARNNSAAVHYQNDMHRQLFGHFFGEK